MLVNCGDPSRTKGTARCVGLLLQAQDEATLVSSFAVRYFFDFACIFASTCACFLARFTASTINLFSIDISTSSNRLMYKHPLPREYLPNFASNSSCCSQPPSM